MWYFRLFWFCQKLSYSASIRQEFTGELWFISFAWTIYLDSSDATFHNKFEQAFFPDLLDFNFWIILTKVVSYLKRHGQRDNELQKIIDYQFITGYIVFLKKKRLIK